MALLSFKDMYTAEYRPGEDELVNYRAYRRKRISEDTNEEVDEALNVGQRMKRSRIMKRMKARIKVGRDRAKRKMADQNKLKRRAMRKARDKIVRRITKDIPKKDLTYARKQEIEKRLDKPQFKSRIQRLAKRMYTSIRKAEVQRKKG